MLKRFAISWRRSVWFLIPLLGLTAAAVTDCVPGIFRISSRTRRYVFATSSPRLPARRASIENIRTLCRS